MEERKVAVASIGKEEVNPFPNTALLCLASNWITCTDLVNVGLATLVVARLDTASLG
jgi:hypothetical protein